MAACWRWQRCAVHPDQLLGWGRGGRGGLSTGTRTMSEQSPPGLSTWDSGLPDRAHPSTKVAVVTAEDLGESGHPESHCHRVLQGLHKARTPCGS